MASRHRVRTSCNLPSQPRPSPVPILYTRFRPYSRTRTLPCACAASEAVGRGGGPRHRPGAQAIARLQVGCASIASGWGH
eukprot:9706175-Alexandrium_andersonii.AAC.1